MRRRRHGCAPGLTPGAERYPILRPLFCVEGEDQPAMSIKNKAYIVGIFEHPTRKADDKSLFQLHAECAQGALADAGLAKNDIARYFCAPANTPALLPLSLTDYLA